jgi:chromate transporter
LASPYVSKASPNLIELARVFLRLGATAFGGPAAHVALMEDELVTRRRWLSHDAFLDYLGAVNLIPGPNSTELAIHVGYVRAGWAGLIVAGASFILPAAVFVTVLAWIYVRFGQLPPVTAALYGVKPIIVGIVLHALWRLARTALRSPVALLIASGSIVAAAVGVHELIVLAAAGIVAAIAALGRRPAAVVALAIGAFVHPARTLHAATRIGLAYPAAAGTISGIGLAAIFGTFLKIGSVLFGSGYVLLAFLRADVIERHHWLSEGQLLDAVAAGQITPGPVSTTATFIGYLLAGLPGALTATIGIFLPAFVFVAISGPLVPKIRQSAVAGSLLDGVNAGALALMALVTWQLGRAAVVDVPTGMLAIVAASVLFLTPVNSMLLMGAGAIVGWFVLLGREAHV